MSYSLNKLYEVVGISKQAVHQYQARQQYFEEQLEVLLLEVDALRIAHPGCGLEKMYYTLQPSFIGRDRFIVLLMQLGYRVKKKPNYRRTTRSGPTRYPNKIKGMEVDSPLQIWQSDITYIRVKENFYYAVFILDVYTKIIVGHKISDHLRATANVMTLKKALATYGIPKYHHSDAGSQYGYKNYVELLERHKIEISMGQRAQENAYAERIHRTIKEEYLSLWNPQTYRQLQRQTAKAVRHYNQDRLHNSLARKSPVNFAQYWAKLTPEQRPRITIKEFDFLT
jgi:transposase InsO family protein